MRYVRGNRPSGDFHLHANSANQALDRSSTLSRGAASAIAHRSVGQSAGFRFTAIDPDGGWQTAAIEILLHSPMVETLIKRGEVAGLQEIMEKATGMGMTFRSAYFELA